MTASDESSPSLDPSVTVALVLGARREEEQALAELYERTQPALEAWLRPLMHDRPAEVVEASQEVWLRAMGSLDRYDPSSARFRTWLFSIAKHVVLEFARRDRRWKRDGAAAGRTSRMRVIAEKSGLWRSASQVAARSEIVERLLAALEKRDKIDRKIFNDFGIEGRSCPEIAEKLGMTTSAVQKRWQRLCQWLRDSGVEPGMFVDE